MSSPSPFALRRLVLGLWAASPAVFAQAPAAPPPAAEGLTEVQQVQYKELEGDFNRLESFLAGLPDSQPKIETKRVLDGMRKRAAKLYAGFDQTQFDEIRWEVNFEHQQMLLWLQEPRLRPRTAEAPAGSVNTLSNQEKSSGWELLFDGRSFAGWRGYLMKGPPPSGWEIRDGTLRTAGGAESGIDLITERKFTNFEFMWEWRVAPGANSGVKYFVTESRPSAPGHEYQLIDDEGDPWRAWRGEVHRTGAFYDVVPPAGDKPMKPAGEWNVSRLLVAGRRVEHWLNGRKVLTYELGSPVVKKGIARSKFKDEPAFGESLPGHLLITYHATESAFRNLKIRELK